MQKHPTLSAILLAACAILLVATPMGVASRGSEAEADLEAAVRTWFASRFGTRLLADEALARAAREHSEVLSTGARLETQEFLRQALSRHGVIDPFPYVFHGHGPRGSLGEIQRRLQLHLAQLPPKERSLYTHLAVGVHERRRGNLFHRRTDTYVTVILTQRSISFSALPRDLRPGDRFLFEGEVHPPFSDPEVLLTSPRGTTIELVDHAEDRLAFRAWVQVDDTPGEYQLEILGNYDMGPRVLALCSLYPRAANEPLPYERLLRAARDGILEPSLPLPTAQEAHSETEAEELMLRLVNEDRRKAGLAPLVAEPRLALMARHHSRDMRDARFFAHVSPRRGHLADRAEREDIDYRRMGENIAVGVDVREAQKALLRSPGHRRNLLDPHFTHIGIGVAFDKDVSGQKRVFVTQDFMVPVAVSPARP